MRAGPKPLESCHFGPAYLGLARLGLRLEAGLEQHYQKCMENDIDLYSECPLRTLLPRYSNDAKNAPVAIDALMCVSCGPTKLDHVVMWRSVLEVLRPNLSEK
jgi:hypothetical protein